MGLITVCALLTDGATYSFVPPPGWRVSADATEKKLSFVSPDNALITLHVIATRSENPIAVATGSLRNQVLDRYSAARFVEEMPCTTADGTGQAFDFLWSTGHGANFKTRFATMSAKGERIELVLTSKPETFPSHHYTFSSFLNSFQIRPASRN
jgi:hypothetical protein